MPSPTRFCPVSTAATKRRKPGRPSKQSKESRVQFTATVSQATRERLIADALSSPAFEGIEPAAVSAFINGKLDQFIIVYPWWFGRLRSDAPRKPLSVAQRSACERMRARKAAIQRETEAPYVRECSDASEALRARSDSDHDS